MGVGSLKENRDYSMDYEVIFLNKTSKGTSHRDSLQSNDSVEHPGVQCLYVCCFLIPDFILFRGKVVQLFCFIHF